MSDFSVVKKILTEGFKLKAEKDALLTEEEDLRARFRKQLSGRLIKDIGVEELTQTQKVEHKARIEKIELISNKINKLRMDLFDAILDEKYKTCFTEESCNIFLKMRALLKRDKIDSDTLFLRVWSFTGDLSKYTKKIDREYLTLINTPEKKIICTLVHNILFNWGITDFERFCRVENLRKVLKTERYDLKNFLESLNCDYLSEEINRVIVGIEPKMLETMLVLSATLSLPFQPNLEVVAVLTKNLSLENIETVLKILLSTTTANVEVLEKIRDEISPEQQARALNLAITQTQGISPKFVSIFSSAPYVQVTPACHKLLLLSSSNPQTQVAEEILLHKRDTVTAMTEGNKRFSFHPDGVKFYSNYESLKSALLKITIDFSEIENLIDTIPITAREFFIKKEIEAPLPNNKVVKLLIHYIPPGVRNSIINKLEIPRIQEMLAFSGTLPFIPDTEVVEVLSNRLSVEQKETVIKSIVSQVTPNPEVIKILTSDDNVKTDAALHKVLLQSRPNMKVAKALYRKASGSFKEKNGLRYESLLKQQGEEPIVSPVHAFKRFTL